MNLSVETPSLSCYKQSPINFSTVVSFVSVELVEVMPHYSSAPSLYLFQILPASWQPYTFSKLQVCPPLSYHPQTCPSGLSYSVTFIPEVPEGVVCMCSLHPSPPSNYSTPSAICIPPKPSLVRSPGTSTLLNRIDILRIQFSWPLNRF